MAAGSLLRNRRDQPTINGTPMMEGANQTHRESDGEEKFTTRKAVTMAI